MASAFSPIQAACITERSNDYKRSVYETTQQGLFMTLKKVKIHYVAQLNHLDLLNVIYKCKHSLAA